MNPYIWQPVDEAGNDMIDLPIGSVYNMINVPSLSLFDARLDEKGSNRLFKGYELDKGKVTKTPTTVVVTSNVYEKYSLVDAKAPSTTTTTTTKKEGSGDSTEKSTEKSSEKGTGKEYRRCHFRKRYFRRRI